MAGKGNILPLLTLSFTSSVLLSVPWLVPHTGALALVGLFPLLFAEDCATQTGTKHFFLCYFSAFVLWNALTTFWVCNATVGGGIFAILANSLQMSLLFALFRCSRRRLEGALPYIFLAAAWIAWERFYHNAQISWPWLTLGNAFAGSTHSVQWYEYTGVLGGSLWVWACNLGIYGLFCSLATGKWRLWNAWGRILSGLAVTLVVAAPLVWSSIIYRNYEERSEAVVDTVVAQPDFDPYEKFGSMTQEQQNEVLLSQFAAAVATPCSDVYPAADARLHSGDVGCADPTLKGPPSYVAAKAVEISAAADARLHSGDVGCADPTLTGPPSYVAEGGTVAGVDLATQCSGTVAGVDLATQCSGTVAGVDLATQCSGTVAGVAPRLLVAPETFTGDVILSYVENSPTIRSFRDFLKSADGCSLLFGASTYDLYERRSAPSILARPYGPAAWIESHNSALMMRDAEAPVEVYHKSRLVIGTELTPYPKVFVPIENAIAKMVGQSGLMGHCIGQKEASVLHLSDSTAIGCAVCYESVYGEYCAEYVRKGARALAVITNDAWWGNTPGYRQHCSYSALRAIELRRDIARSANTGISAFIDQRGDFVSKTPWWTRCTLEGKLNLNSEETFFVRHGDFVGRLATLVFLLLAALLLVKILIKHKNQ